MLAATLSSKYQLSVPKTVREELGLKAGQKFSVLIKGGVIELVPLRPIEQARGMLKGANPADYRDRTSRF